MDKPKTDKRSLVVNFLLACVLLGAFAIRYKGIAYGLPAITRQDEVTIMRPVLTMVQNKDANPHFFCYPSLFLYMQAGLCEAMVGYGRVTGSFSSLQEVDMSTIFLAGRFLVLLLSMGTLLAVYFIGKLLFNRGTGVVAALILSFCSLHVANSVYNSVDSPMTFWVTLVFMQAALVYRRGPKWITYILGALFTGFAIGTKYNAILSFLPLALAHFHAHSFSWRALFHRKFLVAALLVVLAFLATTPYALLSFREFSRDIHYVTLHYSQGHLGATAASVSYLQYADLLRQGFGLWLTLVALGASVHLAIRDWRLGIFCVLYPLAFFLFIGMYRAYFLRNLLSLTPFLALLVAYGVMQAAHFFWQTVRLNSWPSKRLTAVGAALVIGATVGGLLQQGLYSYHHISASIRIDTRLQSDRWIKANLPRGARIAREKYTPRLNDEKFLVKRFGFWRSLKQKSALDRFDYVITSSHTYDRYYRDRKKYSEYVDFYEYMFARYECIRTFAPDGVHTTGPTIKVLRVKRKKPTPR